MCQYCEEPTRNIKLHRQDTDTNIIECFIHKCNDGAALFMKQNFVTRIINNKIGIRQMNEYAYMDIYYCPFCGRKL